MLLEIKNLRKVFRTGWLAAKASRAGDVVALRNINLAIKPREILGLVGESGSGKSTLANCILGLEKPDQGEILFHGELLNREARSRQKGRIQAVFQDPDGSLNPNIKVDAIIREPLDVLKTGGKEQRLQKVSEVMARVGLSADLASARPNQLSGGQKQRVAIARALVADPELLVADEPVSALDVSVQAQILNLLGSLREQLGLTILLISHDLNVVGQICDRVAVMVRGGVVEIAPTELLFRSAQHPYTRALLASIVPLQPQQARRWVEVEIEPWQGEAGSLREVAPGHWVAEDPDSAL